MLFKQINGIRGEFEPPPDKSITHRAFILAAMAEGKSTILNPLKSLDTRATLEILRSLGVEIVEADGVVKIFSGGVSSFKSPLAPLYCGNSGTTARLMMGVLTPAGVTAILDGDESLRKRPMWRVVAPLREMGANITGAESLPVTISPADMYPSVPIQSDIASAQVKSAILLAGVQLAGETIYNEPAPTRDHTERMLKQFGADIKKDGLTTCVTGGKLRPCDVRVCGDISSAAALIAAVFMYDNSELTIRNVGLNPTRTGFLDILKSWGADIRAEIRGGSDEPCGDIFVKSSKLIGGEISGEVAANAIDELPLLAMLGLFTKNGVVLRGVGELRHKESDRIKAVVDNLRAIGAKAEEFSDGLRVCPLVRVNAGAVLDSMGDHRIAMMNILLGKKWGLGIEADDFADVEVSFPSFLSELERLEC